MKRKALTAASILLLLASAGAQVASHAPTRNAAPGQQAVVAAALPEDRPVARVNGSVLTSRDLLREEYAIFPYGRQHNGIPKDLAAQIHDGALNMLIFEELVYQEALRRKMAVSPAKMQSAQAAFRSQFATPDEFNALLRSNFHGSQKELNEKIRRSLLIEEFLNSEVESRSTVSAAELRAWYDNNPARFEHPESYTFQTISVLPPPNATAAQLKEGSRRADDAWRQASQARTSEAFGLLAEKLSDDDYRVMMGQHRPVPVGQLAPQVVKALRALHPGDVSGVIQIEQAYTILHLQEHTPAGKTKFEDVKEQLRKELQQKKRNQLRAALDRSLRQKARIEEF